TEGTAGLRGALETLSVRGRLVHVARGRTAPAGQIAEARGTRAADRDRAAEGQTSNTPRSVRQRRHLRHDHRTITRWQRLGILALLLRTQRAERGGHFQLRRRRILEEAQPETS